MSKTALIDHLYEAWHRGPVSPLRLGSQDAVLVTGPEAVRQVLVHDAARCTKRSHRARSLLGDGLITATGERWKRQRRALQSHFTAVGVRRYERHIAGAAQHIADRWEHCARTGEPTDVAEDMRYFALDTIWRLLTGTPLDARTHDDLSPLARVVAALPTLSAPGRAPSAAPQTQQTQQTRQTRQTQQTQQTRQAPERDGAAEGPERVEEAARRAVAAARAAGPGDGRGILHDLLDYPDQLLRDELVTLIVAGHETTATALTWLHLLLDRHPWWRAWALRRGPAGHRALITETLRLYPPVWLIPRHADEDTVLDGRPVAAGTRVLVCPYLTHRDPALWPAPLAFDPRRPAARPQSGAFHPFGTGPRACLGQHFSLREMEILTTTLLPRFVPRPTSPASLSPTFAATLYAAGPCTATVHPVAPDGPGPAALPGQEQPRDREGAG
ncbi:cytochrome P450 [Streptomyces sp. NRRL F-5053]|uniref:cytochrome P450 n=1 Tax=Streptomyces sp. NRRL F-5053 TaxID=1463854 RepID=UPI00068B4D31|nr:cytochrome P450 [Streptomyces sp. NRRL F-5053]